MACVDVTESLVRQSIPVRRDWSHKGDYGKLLIVSGCRKYVGAPYFAAQAAVNTGTGLAFLACPEGIHGILATKLNEPIFLPQKQDREGALSPDTAEALLDRLGTMDACVIGCGLGRGAGARRTVEELVCAARIPTLVDADALYFLAQDPAVLENAAAPLVLTPHEGEFLRLEPAFTPEQREECAREFAVARRVTLVLKGHRTLIAAPDGTVYRNTTGNAGMAKGGSGDVLAGMIGSLLGQGIPPVQAAYIGVWLHGKAGDLCRDAYSDYGMTPTDMLAGIKQAFCNLRPPVPWADHHARE